MDLERLSVALRPRNPWEAIDLGVRFALCHARPLYAAWFAVSLPTALLVLLLLSLSGHALTWAGFVMWWLKPLLDRVALHVLSQMTFGETPSVRQTLRALPRLLRHSRLLAALSWGRFSLKRGIHLPVDVLEGLKGKAGRQRKRLLSRRVDGPASWHTLAWLHLETLLWLALLGMVAFLLPESLWPEAEDFSSLLLAAPTWLSLLIVSTQLGCSLLLEPLYVAGGFMLYLKRRTDLEAWDVELDLRRLARRRAARLLMPLLALMLAGGVACLTPRPAMALDSAALREARVERAATAIDEVMKDPAFGVDKTRRDLHWRTGESARENSGSTLAESLRELFKGFAELVETVFGAIAEVGRVGAWLAIIAAVVLLAWLLRRYLPPMRAPERSPVPAEVAGFDIRPASLPDDVAAAAAALAASGKPRAALSLLFRATLSQLAYREGIVFRRGDTETDCLERTHRQAPRHAPYFTRLLDAWQSLAYAHRPLPGEQLLALCGDWQDLFGRPRA